MVEQAQRDYQELADQYAELEEQTNLIINDLEQEVTQLRRKNELQAREITEQKVLQVPDRTKPGASRVPSKGRSTKPRRNATSSRRSSSNSRRRSSSLK